MYYVNNYKNLSSKTDTLGQTNEARILHFAKEHRKWRIANLRLPIWNINHKYIVAEGEFRQINQGGEHYENGN